MRRWGTGAKGVGKEKGKRKKDNESEVGNKEEVKSKSDVENLILLLSKKNW